MRLDIVNSFITQKEADELNEFTLKAIESGEFSEGQTSKHVNPSGSHLVSRYNYDLKLPDLAFEIKKRIINIANLNESDTFKRFSWHGIVINCSFKNAKLAKHKDLGIQDSSKALLRCNVVTSQPNKGGILFVDNVQIDLKERDMYTCLVSEYEHYTTTNEDDKPRIVWQFGFNVDKNIWEKGSL